MKLLTASVTPFLPDHSIDFLSFENLLRFQERESHGVVLLGSTGESLSMTAKEKESLVSYACSLNLKVPIIVGVPGTSLHEASEWIHTCQSYPIYGFLITTPIYTKPGVHGQTLWFESLLNKANKPAILYNIPSRSGTTLYLDTVRSLAAHPFFYGLKDSGGSIKHCQEYAQMSSDFVLYCGDDGLWPQMYECGAQGLISVLSNIWPKEAREWVEDPHHQYRADLWREVSSWLNQTTNPIAIKALLAYEQVIAHNTLRLPLSIQDLQCAESIPEIIKKMAQWKCSCAHV
ncbi:4-hydroxy-tetrahydrodipicolinate synthase [Chlamydia abortus]|uniref:4-hydroxy-tetrahydrodipicolinate synthase n=1 Tax=Chlamydia abortus TaxID=83555 RepID=UPI0011EBB92B|nr:4-hydroxy-tetrahydrodipicolinate synthase [Chlamydia abortus]QEM74021.1 4-hydroxy-tetrahydrodipicolinate synthase [Chlamydia abortus]